MPANRGCDVAPDLLSQRRRIGKALLGTQVGMQHDLDLFVELREVLQCVGLERDAGVVGEGGANPQVSDRSNGLRSRVDGGHVDALQRKQAALRIEVQRWHAHDPAPAVPGRYLALDGVITPQQGRDQRHLRATERVSHARRRDGLSEMRDSSVNCHCEAGLGAEERQHGGVSGSTAAEAKILSHMHLCQPGVARDQKGHKGLWRHGGERRIKREPVHPRDAERAQGRIASIRRLQPEGVGLAALEEGNRVRLKGDRYGIGLQRFAASHRSVDQASVAEVHTVEVSNGDDGALIRRLHRLRLLCGEGVRRASARTHLGRCSARCQMFAKGRFAVVGSDVGQSASPAMQNAALQAVGQPATYEALSLTEPELRGLVRRLQSEGYRGLNFTAPYKGLAFELAGRRSAVVEAVEAANTWRVGGGRFEAFNTDVDGLAAMLLAHGGLSRGQRVVLLGAGGAARAAAFVLGQWASSVLVINRTAARARALCSAQLLRPDNAARWQALALQHPGDLPALREAFSDASLIIDAVGDRSALRCAGHEARLPWRELDPRAELFDLAYGAAPSPLSIWSGRACFDGATMLLHQGAAAFEHWTGHAAPLEVMRDALAKQLGRPAATIPLVPTAIGSVELRGQRE